MIPWITCRDVVDFLDRYLTGELDPDEVAKFERHLSECPPCVAYMHTYQAAAALSRAALADVPAVEIRAISNEIGEPDRSRWKVDEAIEELSRVTPLLLARIEATLAA